MSEYKNTILLPKTDFPMKASLPTREPEMVKKWDALSIYRRMLSLRQGAPRFVLHDGPPYANGHIHMGHALNKILKDMTVKYRHMKGSLTAYIPGWDCHGLPIEHQLLKAKNKTKNEVDALAFRKEAKDYALKWVTTQTEEFQRLGVFGDYAKPYLTLDPEYETAIVKSLAEIHRKGHMYTANKPVYWCMHCETALAEAEVEYADKQSDSIFVSFPLTSDPKVFLVIWTTTPWTLPANLAVAVHEKYLYSKVKLQDKHYIVAKDLLPSFLNMMSLAQPDSSSDHSIIWDKEGRELEGTEYHHPFLDRVGKVILSEFVTLDTGSGLVHTAPGHGQEDYVVGQRYGLQVLSPVNASGEFTSEAGIAVGEKVYKGNPLVLDVLKERQLLLDHKKISHSYPHCWRCKYPVIFRATEQWFISMDHQGLREKSLKVIDEVNWIPSFGKSRIRSMVESRPDWCISRQRLWGVPIPSISCKDCGLNQLHKGLLDKLIPLIEQSGVDAWYDLNESRMDEWGIVCENKACRGNRFEKGQNIVDVWFESGVSHAAVMEKRAELDFPADLYLEGSDQHRGWFQSSLLTAAALKESKPFKSVLTHGFVVDGQGHKMSKSQGNVVDPLKIIAEHGADILRLWVASVDYSLDARISEKHFSQLADAYRKVRNTFRFLLGNLSDFDPVHRIAYKDMLLLDLWAINALNKLIAEVTEEMEHYRFFRGWQKIYQFCTNEMSALYLNIQKDVLYCDAQDGVKRKSCQTVLYDTLEVLIKLTAPFLSFTAEEVLNYSPLTGKPDSVFLYDWPKPLEVDMPPQSLQRMDEILVLRDEIYRQLENLVQSHSVKTSTQAKVELHVPGQEDYEFYCSINAELAQIFIVGSVIIHKTEDENKEIAIDVKAHNGLKCERCWIYFDPSKHNEELCERCHQVLIKN